MAEFNRKEAKAWALENVKDFYAAPITPMNPDGTIDEAGLRENVEAYLDWGVDGLVVGGFASETWNLQPEEWYRYHEIYADAVKGRTDLWSIILDPSAQVTVRKMDFIEKLGFSGAEIMNPMTQLRGDDEIYDYFEYIANRSDLGICLYRTPVSGKVMSFDLMARIADLDTVVCTKQGVLNRLESLDMRRQLRDDFIVSDPVEYWYLDDLRLGGQVLFAEFSYLLYGKKRHLLRSYVDKARAGKWEEAYQEWLELRPAWNIYYEWFMKPLVASASYAALLPVIKIWGEALGLKGGPMSPPIHNFSDEKRERLQAAVKEAGIA